MFSRAFTLLFALAVLLAVVVPAHAQPGALTLSSLEVDLWPEYDQPSVLVIYRIVLPPGVSLPVDLSLRIPAAAGEPSAVAVRQVSTAGTNDLFTIPYQRQVDGEWGLISLTATAPELQIEYYDPGLTKDGATRSFAYNWPGDYAVDALSIQVQQPVGATDMQISPASGAGAAGGDGLVYYNKAVGSLPAGETFTISFTYQKESDDLSAANQQVEPSAPLESPAASQLNWRSILPWVLGVAGVSLIVGGGWWYWQSGRGKEREEPRRRRRAAGTAEAPAASGAQVYCHQCGTRAGPGDRFCRTCGARLRTE
jgi:hypothetical protein